jgi:hypothetical protein
MKLEVGKVYRKAYHSEYVLIVKRFTNILSYQFMDHLGEHYNENGDGYHDNDVNMECDNQMIITRLNAEFGHLIEKDGK